MYKSKTKSILNKNKYGFYQYKNKPTEDELEKYYSEKYYQEELGNYNIFYSNEELEWNKLKSWLIYRETEKIFTKKVGRMLDVGCGEGWLLNKFYKNNWSVVGMDFSKYAIERYHPHLLNFFEQGSIYKLINRKIKEGEKFDVIFLGNVIEHVINPIKLLSSLQLIMTKKSILIITAPNDFSPLQKYLVKNKYTRDNWWLAYPDHLSYFNKKSVENITKKLGLKIKAVIADSVIDLNLLNNNSNYIQDVSRGGDTHIFRIRVDTFLASIDPEKLLNIYENYGSMGVGRDLIYYCQLK